MFNNHDEYAAAKGKTNTCGKGYINMNLETAKEKKTPEFHLAVIWEEIPEHAKGSKDNSKITFVQAQGRT